MILLTAKQMRELDRAAIEDWHVPGPVLMENAGKATVDQLEDVFAELCPGPVTILAGKGNNGGDGYVIARHLLNRGWQVLTIVLAAAEKITGDARINLDILLKSEAEVLFVTDSDELERLLPQLDPIIVVDALFGTGLFSAVSGLYEKAIDWANEAAEAIIAVDIPSGIDATSGKVLGTAVAADLTVTFACAKVGQVIYPGAEYVGDLVVADIGIPVQLLQQQDVDHHFIDFAAARFLLPERPASGHKGTFGHLLLVAGSSGKSGAAALAAEAALRAGVGLATLACPAQLHPVFEEKLTEVMTVPLPEVDGRVSMQALVDIQQLWQQKSVLAVGPGLGTGEEVAGLVRRLVRECPLPLVVDADGLNALAGHLEILQERMAPTVLTPHPGEMARLTGLSVAEVESDRISIARQVACSRQVVVVLKGARTIVATPDGAVFINGSGNPALASGGTGDVLTGVISGLLAQGMKAEAAALLGVYLHGRSADRLAESRGQAGVLASDLLADLPATREELLTGDELC
ncbi:MAG: bifunctional ADP-dependent NAD(P)H-hydrate dehydratase/NAD(P)H-hydrate epimerase [Desulfuromonas sp.]|nr:MAG: bifunctional ADP-dependent NAD(P)H-hydrate dehydratase/NAD(P)H-hydrate epimerase [Desulfuromonas sp.]